MHRPRRSIENCLLPSLAFHLHASRWHATGIHGNICAAPRETGLVSFFAISVSYASRRVASTFGSREPPARAARRHPLLRSHPTAIRMKNCPPLGQHRTTVASRLVEDRPRSILFFLLFFSFYSYSFANYVGSRRRRKQSRPRGLLPSEIEHVYSQNASSLRCYR